MALSLSSCSHTLIGLLYALQFQTTQPSLHPPTGYDYTQPGAYYITICTYQKQCWFGDVVNNEMHWNQLGYIAHSFWQALPRRFPRIQLDTFVVMPNHLHGILVITDEQQDTATRHCHTPK